MSKLIVTNDVNNFVIYDTIQEAVTYLSPKTESLDAHHLAGQGRDTFRPFGIAQDKHFIYIASNDRLGQFKKDTFEFVKLIDVPLWINTHQILFDNETLYTCNTAIDTIGVYHPDFQKQISINYMKEFNQVLQPKYADQLDTRHVNTLYDAGEYIMFMRHNRNIVMSDIGFMDKLTQTPRIAFSLGRCCHGIAIDGNVLYTLSTGTGELIALNLEDKKAVKYPLVDPTMNFLRGLEIVEDKIFVGNSVNFKAKASDRSAKLIEIDINNKDSIKVHNMDGIKIINDLKVLSDG